MYTTRSHALDRVLGLALQPWAMEPTMLATLAGILFARVQHGPRPLEADEQAALHARQDARGPAPAGGGAVAVIPIHGVIAPRMTALSDISGGATFEGLREDLKAAVDSPRIHTIVLDIDSPGGSVLGARVFARELLAARTKKPVIAQIEYQGNSAAYWAASCATEIVAAPGALLGAIGVYLIHDDISAALLQEGIKRTMVHAGPHKLDANENLPLSDRALARLQALVSENYAAFLTDVGLGRGVAAEHVKTDFGGGNVLTAEEGIDRKMVDRIATLDETLTRLGVSPSSTTVAAAHAALAPQEPSRATGADLAAQVALERQVLALGL